VPRWGRDPIDYCHRRLWVPAQGRDDNNIFPLKENAMTLDIDFASQN
jgi:hypothetical protein